MIIVKGWVDHPDVCVVSKVHEHISFETAILLIGAAKDGPVKGYIRMPGGMILEYNRYANGRIVVKQSA